MKTLRLLQGEVPGPVAEGQRYIEILCHFSSPMKLCLRFVLPLDVVTWILDPGTGQCYSSTQPTYKATDEIGLEKNGHRC